MMRVRLSRPRWSVPNQCFAEGAASIAPAIAEYARKHGLSRLVVGRSRHRRWRWLQPRSCVEQLARLERGDFSEEKRVLREERFQIPLALALLLLLVEGLLGDRRSRVAEQANAPAGSAAPRQKVAA